MAAKVGEKKRICLLFEQNQLLFQKKIFFSAFIPGKNVFLPNIINRVILKDYERIS
ncbi:hypothetical protein [Bacteroides ndongoniae]|uniref:hypothetical protein n=1 Tax=Bacteroides ndongoniae TaxID=1903262 RepID=UPI0013563E67|nr:hypothetical protein [Bacteroides ndongoniae]